MENKVIMQLNLPKLKEDFISYLDVSPLTLNTYRNGIESFVSYLEENNISRPDRNDFRNYRDTLKEIKSLNTVNSYMTAIRCFLKYLEANNLYQNITKDVKSLKYSNVPKTQVLNQEQCSKIYQSLTDIKDKCLFAIAISTGLRANEIATAKIENIKEYNNEIVLFVKCKKRDDESEYVKLSKQVLNDIKNYIGDRTQGNIFISTSNHSKGNGVTNKTIRLWIKDIFKRFGIEQDWFSCHTLRKSACTIAYNLGADIVQIQQMAHHQSLVTTRRYINQCTRDSNKIELQLSNAILGGE